MFFKRFYFVFFLFSLVHTKPKRKLDLKWESVSECPSFVNTYTDVSRVKVYLSDESTVSLSGDFEIKQDLMNPPIQVVIDIEKFVGMGSYLPILLYDLGDVCLKLAENGTQLADFLSKLKPRLPQKCPLLKKKYDVSDMISEPQAGLSKDMVGKYKLTVSGYMPGAGPGSPLAKVACYIVELKVEYE